MENNGTMPAFPAHFESSPEDRIHVDGLTKREYFAAMAMQGMCANSDLGAMFKGGRETILKQISEVSVLISDALLEQLENK